MSNRLIIGETVPADWLRRVMATGEPESVYVRGAPSHFAYLAPLRGRSDDVEGAIEIVRMASAVDRRLRAAVADVVVRLGLLLVVIVAVTLVVMQRQVLRPLAALMAGIQALGEGRPGPALPVERRDELGRLATAFNEMAARLDISQSRLIQLEQQLRQASMLAVAGKLATAVAHEVGTPLTIIGGRAEFVLKTLPDDAPARKDLEIIVAQIDRITAVIGSLLDTVRPHGPDLAPTRMAAVLDPLTPLLRHTAARRGVALTVAAAPPLPPVRGDAGQLQQVLINLVVNAVDATPAGGAVTVEVRPATRAGTDGITLSVTDTGSGIPPELLPRVVEPFVTTKPRGQGTGLGLAICRDIVQAHGGELAIAAAPGGGTRATVWLPGAAGALA
jgi:signal transduction histidine kinase